MINADDVIDALERGIGRLDAKERQSYLESLGFEFEAPKAQKPKTDALMTAKVASIREKAKRAHLEAKRQSRLTSA